jgi:uncharacterized protein YjbJ (UPF0337 family)
MLYRWIQRKTFSFHCEHEERSIDAQEARNGPGYAGLCRHGVVADRLQYDSGRWPGFASSRPRPGELGGAEHYVSTVSDLRETEMDKDRIEGAGKQAKGSVKEAWGKVTGDAKTEAEGKADKAEGRVQNTVGGVKDSAREARDKVTGKE